MFSRVTKKTLQVAAGHRERGRCSGGLAKIVLQANTQHQLKKKRQKEVKAAVDALLSVRVTKTLLNK